MKKTQNVRKQKQKQSNGSRTARKRNKGSPKIKSAWLASILNPFTYGGVHIPDERTVASGLVTSKLNLRTNASAIGGSSTNHSFGILIPPHINCGIFKLDETSAGNGQLTDLNVTGTTLLGVTGWPNLASAVPGAAKHRMVSLGVRVVYEGTELNRSARIFAGSAPSVSEAFSVALTGTQLSALSTVINAPVAGLTSFANTLQNQCENRSDGIFSTHWVPNGVTSYQEANVNNANLLTQTANTTTRIPNSLFNAAMGTGGVEAGQNCFVVIVEGDTSTTSGTTGNTYSFEIVAHWEVVPENPTAVSYDISTSYFIPSELAECLNTCAMYPSGQQTMSAGFTNVIPTSTYDLSSMAAYLPSMNTMLRAARLASQYYGSSTQNEARMLTY